MQSLELENVKSMKVRMDLVSVKRCASRMCLPPLDATILTKAQSPPTKVVCIRLYKHAKDYLHVKEATVECGTRGEVDLELVARQLQVSGVCRVSKRSL